MKKIIFSLLLIVLVSNVAAPIPIIDLKIDKTIQAIGTDKSISWPMDIEVDNYGNILVLDAGNCRWS